MNVLLVGAVEPLEKLLQSELGAKGYTVVSAHDATSSDQVSVQSNSYHAVIIDSAGVDGRVAPIVGRYRRECPDCILVVLGKPDTTTGIDVVLHKPFLFTDLLDGIGKRRDNG